MLTAMTLIEVLTMRTLLLVLLVLALPVLRAAGAAPAGTSAFRLEPLAAGADITTIPWVVAGEEAWQQGAPVFSIADTLTPLAAKGWLATTDSELLIRVDVKDAVHINNQDRDAIWNGDFLRIGIDGKGDGNGGGAANLSGLFGPDDASIGFALTPKGAQGWVYVTSNTAFAGAYPAELLHFTRDEATQITRYVIRLPWNRLGVQPGAFPTFGIAVQVRNIDQQEQADPVQIRWGAGTDEPKPGLFQKIAVASPPHALYAAIPAKSDIWGPDEDATVLVAIASQEDVVIHASSGTGTAVFPLPGDKTLAVRRYLLHYHPAASIAEAALQVNLTRVGDITPCAQTSASVVVAEQIVQRLYTRLDTLIAHARHPLFLRHLRSMKAIVQAEWAREAEYKKTNTAQARETLGYIRSISDGFAGKSAKWSSYVKDGFPLMMSYHSSRDGSLQWYGLTLPKGWNPGLSREKQAAYPMFFELHGAGNPHYLNFAATQLGLGEQSTGLLGYDRPQTFAMIQRHGYHVFPYGRGNAGYRGAAETDVWDAYDDAQRTVKIDPDRRYLYGFSMGAGGTWDLGSRTPDRWAAIAILSMGRQVGDWGQADNVKYLPIWTWAGEIDNIAFRGTRTPKEQIAAFAEAIKQAGGTIVASTTPGIGHNYLGAKQQESLDWMQQFTRKRPQSFSFTADTDLHRGVWGITMARDAQQNAHPRFTCAIDAQTIKITTTGTTHLDVDLGAHGLQVIGEITLLINGEQRYHGPAGASVLSFDITTP